MSQHEYLTSSTRSFHQPLSVDWKPVRRRSLVNTHCVMIPVSNFGTARAVPVEWGTLELLAYGTFEEGGGMWGEERACAKLMRDH